MALKTRIPNLKLNLIFLILVFFSGNFNMLAALSLDLNYSIAYSMYSHISQTFSLKNAYLTVHSIYTAANST
jgi:hypothetical protein